jgi:hypothetical protein
MGKKKVSKAPPAEGPAAPPKVPPRKKKDKNPSNLQSIGVVIGTVIIAFLANNFFAASNGEPPVASSKPTVVSTSEVERAKRTREQAMKQVSSNKLLEGLKLTDEAITIDPYNPAGYTNKG